jgi:antitoxin HicB
MTTKPEYPVVLRPLGADDGGGWVAIVPDLPGCMTDGETAFDALKNAADAIEEWKSAAMAMGRPVPHPDDSFRRSLEQAVPDHIRRHAEEYARQITGGRPEPSVVHALIAEWAKAAAYRVTL